MTGAPERIWAVTEPDDISADILGSVYAQQVPDGMVGDPIEYIRADLCPPLLGVEVFDKWYEAEYPALPKSCREYVVANRAFNAGSRTRADLAKPKVKPLVWGRAERNGMTEQADCPNGRYYIAERGEYGWLWFRPNYPTSMGRASTMDAAKAAAQVDYERRILEALE